jgi:hypothetical protein
MLLRIPAGSFKNLAKYAGYLSARNIKSVAAVLTRIKFDADEATPKLVFTPRALLGPDVIAEVKRLAATDLVAQIVGLAPMPHDEDDDTPLDLPQVTMDDVAKAAPEPVKAAPEPVKAAPAPTPEPVKAAAPKRQAKPKVENVATATVAPPAEDQDDINNLLDDLLGKYNG